jgi:hypothetical protein
VSTTIARALLIYFFFFFGGIGGEFLLYGISIVILYLIGVI